jgi:polyisoprenoid-binding protein YceI
MRKFRVERDASQVVLEASQLGVLKHRCRFTEFDGAFALRDDRRLASADLRIRASSLSSAFGRALDRAAASVLLQADRHPWVTVRARDLHLAGRSGQVRASLTLRGRTAEVPLRVTVDEQRRDGSVRLSVEGRVDRREWGVAESLPGMRLGNHISIRAAICAVPA